VDSQGVPLEGPYTLTVALYTTATGGTPIWSELHPNTSFTGGHFSILLGNGTPPKPLDTVDWTQPLWLGVQINTDPELAPRQQITSVPLAITAERLTGPITTVGSNVGIGTTSPGAAFVVASGRAQFTGSAIPSSGTGVEIGYDGTQGILYSLNRGTGASLPLDFNQAALHITSGGNVGIGTTAPGTILTVKPSSATDPIADSWTVYSTSQTKQLLRSADPSGYLDRLRAVPLHVWTRRPRITEEEARSALLAAGHPDPSQAEIDAKQAELTQTKAHLPKFTTQRIGPVVDDPSVPRELIAFNADGTPAGLDLLGYIGYLHAALNEATARIEALEARLNHEQ